MLQPGSKSKHIWANIRTYFRKQTNFSICLYLRQISDLGVSRGLGTLINWGGYELADKMVGEKYVIFHISDELRTITLTVLIFFLQRKAVFISHGGGWNSWGNAVQIKYLHAWAEFANDAAVLANNMFKNEFTQQCYAPFSDKHPLLLNWCVHHLKGECICLCMVGGFCHYVGLLRTILRHAQNLLVMGVNGNCSFLGLWFGLRGHENYHIHQFCQEVGM